MSNDASPRFEARIGGFLYLIIMAAGVFAEGYVRGAMIVSGDAAATARNILAAEPLYRLGGVTEFVTLFCDVTLALILYDLLRPVNRSVALLAAFFRLVFSAVYGTLSLLHFLPLALLGGGSHLTAFTPGQLQALAYLSLKLHSIGYNVSLVFFGVHCVLIGALIAGSTFLPRVIGVALVVAGACYVTNSLAGFISPPFADSLFPYILLPGLVAEGSVALWLFLIGVNEKKWRERAEAMVG